jgi:hypothetical protein
MEKSAQKRKLGASLYGLGQRVIWIFAMITLCTLTIFNFIYHASVLYQLNEVVNIKYAEWFYSVLAFVGLLFLMLVLDKIEHWNERQLFRVLAVVYLIAGAYWILNISTTLRADAMWIQEGAQLSAAGDYSFLEIDHDIRNHPWQLGMVTYERILGLFSKNAQLLFLVNLLAIIGINYFTYRMADMVFLHDHKTNLLTLLFSFGFLPQFFFLAFAYGLIPGFYCMMCGFYYQQRYFREQKIKYAVICVVMTVVATILKGNYVVGAIAMALLFLLHTLRERKIRYLVIALIMMLAIQVSNPMIRAYYSMVSGEELNEGEPKLLYIAMGIMPENRGIAPGWYCGYNDYTFGYANFDPDVASEMAKESIAESLAHYRNDPADAVDFFSKKIASVWCDPLFQSVWSGPREDANQPVRTQILESLYHGGMVEKIVRGYMKVFLLMILVLMVCYVFDRRNRKYDFNYALLYLIGGFLLHIIWEGKSQYVYTYIFILLPGCAYEAVALHEWIQRKWQERTKWKEYNERD